MSALLQTEIRFTAIDNSLLEDSRLTAPDVTVYAAIAYHANHETAIAFPGLKTIAKLAHVSVSTVKRSIARLVELSYLAKETRFDKERKRYDSTLYTLLAPYNRKQDRGGMVTVNRGGMASLTGGYGHSELITRSNITRQEEEPEYSEPTLQDSSSSSKLSKSKSSEGEYALGANICSSRTDPDAEHSPRKGERGSAGGGREERQEQYRSIYEQVRDFSVGGAKPHASLLFMPFAQALGGVAAKYKLDTLALEALALDLALKKREPRHIMNTLKATGGAWQPELEGFVEAARESVARAAWAAELVFCPICGTQNPRGRLLTGHDCPICGCDTREQLDPEDLAALKERAIAQKRISPDGPQRVMAA